MNFIEAKSAVIGTKMAECIDEQQSPNLIERADGYDPDGSPGLRVAIIDFDNFTRDTAQNLVPVAAPH